MSQRVIVYGGRGALGSAAVAAFRKLKWVGKRAGMIWGYLSEGREL